METNRLECFGACNRIEAHIGGMCLGLIVLLLVYASFIAVVVVTQWTELLSGFLSVCVDSYDSFGG
jgi:hypothetical protein